MYNLLGENINAIDLPSSLLALIAYLAYEMCYNNSFQEYKGLIKGLLISQIVIGSVVAVYHSYKLAQRNELL
mgnify:CR=1 FL=1